MDFTEPMGSTFLETCALVDEKISSHLAAITALKTHRNNCAPISRLPVEILCEIFDIVKMQHDSMQCVSFSQVCRSWRKILLDSPMLWTKIPLSDWRWVGEMRRRSQTASLIVEFDYLRCNTRSWHQLICQASRIKSLEATLPVNDWKFFHNHDALLMPQLERLSLTLLSNAYSPIPEQDWDDNSGRLRTVSISDEIIVGTEKLRHLTLQGCKIDWNTRLLRVSLTHLVLQFVGKDTRPSQAQIADILTDLSPTLEYLTLTNALPPFRKNVAVDRRRSSVHLERLRELSVISLSKEIETLFRFITFPPTCDVNITSESLIADPDLTSEFFSCLTASYHRPGTRRPVFHSMVLVFDDDLRLGKPGLFVSFSNSHRLNAEPGYLDITLPCEDTNETFDPEDGRVILEMFNSTLPLGDIDYLELDTTMFFITPSILEDSFSRLSKVATLIVYESCLEVVINILRRPGPLYRNLEALVIYNTSFPPPASNESGEDSLLTSPPTISIEALRDCLVYRHNSGVVLKELIFNFCDLDDHCLRILDGVKEFVQEVSICSE